MSNSPDSPPFAPMPSDLRPGEVAIDLPQQTDAGIYFIGTIHTPWRMRSECPKRGGADGPVCSIVVAKRWQLALTDLALHPRIQVLYSMHRARRDLVLQTPARAGPDHRLLRTSLAGAAKSDRLLGC